MSQSIATLFDLERGFRAPMLSGDDIFNSKNVCGEGKKIYVPLDRWRIAKTVKTEAGECGLALSTALCSAKGKINDLLPLASLPFPGKGEAVVDCPRHISRASQTVG